MFYHYTILPIINLTNQTMTLLFKIMIKINYISHNLYLLIMIKFNPP